MIWPPQLSVCCDTPVIWWHSFCTEEHVMYCVKCQEILAVVLSEEVTREAISVEFRNIGRTLYSVFCSWLRSWNGRGRNNKFGMHARSEV